MKESDNVIIEVISARNDTVVTQVFIENKGVSPSEIIKKLNNIMIKEWSTSGNLAINGTIKHPLFNGVLNIDHLKFGVDYLNVTYAADAQKLVFKNDLIWFNNFSVRNRSHYN